MTSAADLCDVRAELDAGRLHGWFHRVGLLMIDRERSKCVRAERDHKREHRFISATVGALNCQFRLLRFVRSIAMSPGPEQAGSR